MISFYGRVEGIKSAHALPRNWTWFYGHWFVHSSYLRHIFTIAVTFLLLLKHLNVTILLLIQFFMIVAVCVTLTEEQCPVVLSKLYDLETIWYPFYHLWWCYCVLKPMEFSTLFLIFLKKWNVIFECWRYYRAEQQSTVHVAFVWNKPILSVSALQIEIESC